MRRTPAQLLPLELAILGAGIELATGGEPEFYGYAIARALKERGDSRQLTAHGTLYRALDRMARAGWLENRWEDPSLAALEERPRRRLYRVTAEGERAAEAAFASRPRLAEKRTNAIIERVRILGNLANRRAYDYNETDIRKMFAAIENELRTVKATFRTAERRKFHLD